MHDVLRKKRFELKPHMPPIIYYAKQFEREAGKDLRNWVLNSPYDYKITTIRCLETLGLQETTENY